MLCHIIVQKFTDISEMLTASIIRVMMKAASTSEMSVNFTRLHGTTFQKTVISGLFVVNKGRYFNLIKTI
jgi:uncharacterized lipoprotein YmbA